MFHFAVLLLGLPMMGFCSLRVYQVLSQHVSVLSVRLNKTPEQIDMEKSILKAIIIQALVPMICIAPVCFVLVLMLFQGWCSPILGLTIFRYGENHENHYTITHLAQFILGIFPILDSFVTLRVIKSYRQAANQFLAKSKIYRKFTVNRIEPQRDAAARTARR
jgi:hypothetical protein